MERVGVEDGVGATQRHAGPDQAKGLVVRPARGPGVASRSNARTLRKSENGMRRQSVGKDQGGGCGGGGGNGRCCAAAQV